MAGAAVVLAAAPAFAQEQTAPTESPFARDRNISVTQRPRPGYDPLPIHAGGFDVLPQLTAGVAENDNIYAAPSGGKTSDTIFTATPELDVNSNWSRNAVQAFVRVPVDAYVSHSTEDTTDYAVGGSGRLDAGHGQISGGGDTGEYTEARTAVGVSPVSIRPIRYGLTDGFIDAQEEFNRLRVTGRVDIANYKYNNGTAPGGGLVFEEYRDRTDYTYTGKGEYAVSPDTSIYVDADYNQHRYRLTSAPLVSINENSQGEQVNIGANFDLTHVVRGDIQIGYLTQNFVSSTIQTVSGLSALAKVEWFPSDLTTVTLVGSRQLEDAAITASPVYVAGIASLNVDHELLRNLILTGKAGYEDDTFKGVQRDDHRTTAYVGAKYLVNRVVGITLGYTYLDQRSMGAAQGTSYTNNIVSLSTSLKF
jgi:hypothetical protein